MNQKRILIQIRVTQDEKEKIEKQASREHFHSSAAFLRKLALDRVKAD